MKHKILLVAGLLVVMSIPALADDAYITDGFGSPYVEQSYLHEDSDPWKGYVYFTVQNNGTIPWTDFHFEIITIPNWGDATTVNIYDVGSGFDPSTSQSPVSIVVTANQPTVSHAKIDYYFPSDPVPVGDTATFTFYTANPAHVGIFGLVAYPTPEPSLMVLLGTGGLMLLRRRKAA